MLEVVVGGGRLFCVCVCVWVHVCVCLCVCVCLLLCCCGLTKVGLGKNHKLSRARFVVFIALGSDESLRHCNCGTQ